MLSVGLKRSKLMESDRMVRVVLSIFKLANVAED